MSSSHGAARRSPEPVRSALPELAWPDARVVRRLGRVRVPLSLTLRPWATAYRLPDGRTVWCVRLPRDGEVVPSVVSTHRLREFARRSGLTELEASIAELVGPDGW